MTVRHKSLIVMLIILTTFLSFLCGSVLCKAEAFAQTPLQPVTGAATFNRFGNDAQNLSIDKSISIFSKNAQVLSQRPTQQRIFDDYYASSLAGVHPRILATNEDFAHIRSEIETNEFLSYRYAKVRDNANALLNQQPLVYELRDGVRLWYVSMDFIDRMYVLSFMYRITGDSVYAERGYREMQSIALFPTWHPEHHIDVGGLALGYAIGYDWLYDSFTQTQREELQRGAKNQCLSLYLDGLQNKDSNMRGGICATNNHNPVMNCGGAMCALAFFDMAPQECAYIISSSVRASEYSSVNYSPDGAWFEGVNYGVMQMQYYSRYLATLDKFFHNLYGLDKIEGTSEAYQYIMNIQTPMGSFNFYDASNYASLPYTAGVLWFMDYFGVDSRNFDSDIYTTVTDMSEVVSTLLWYKPGEPDTKMDLDTDAYYAKNAIVTMRNSWNTKTPTYAAMKGGCPSDLHGHMDIGSFAFFSDGVRWNTDPGADGYTLDGYFDYSKTEGGRWQYYRMRAEAHNCIIINPSCEGEYEAKSRSYFTRYDTNDTAGYAVLDMTPAQGSKASEALRGYYFADCRQSLVVRDEITPTSDSDMVWFMSTEHQAALDGNSVVLTATTGENVKKARIDFLCDTDYTVTIGKAEPLSTSPNPSGQAANDQYTRIEVRFHGNSGVKTALTAKITPESVINPEAVSAFATSVNSWDLKNYTPFIKLDCQENAQTLSALAALDSDFKVSLRANSYGIPTESIIRFYKKDSSGTETEIPSNQYAASELTVYPHEKQTIYAKAFDDSGNLLCTSDSIIIDEAQCIKDTVWDVDFESITDNEAQKSAQVKFLGSDQKIITNTIGNTLSAYRGAVNEFGYQSKVSIVDSGDSAHGKCIELMSKKSGMSDMQAQLNNFTANVTDSIGVFKIDVNLSDFYTSKVLLGINCDNKNGEKVWVQMLNVNTNGFFVSGSSYKQCNLHQWYTLTAVLDFENQIISFYIDGKFFTSANTVPLSKTNRFSMQYSSTADTTGYADNFKVFHIIPRQ